MIVAHDPGHGHDGDEGCAHHGLFEAPQALAFAHSIADGVRWADHRLLRTDDRGARYGERAAEAKRIGAQLVLLHHVNASDHPEVRGLMAFYDPGDPLGLEAASAIARAAPKSLYRGGATPATHLAWPRVLWCLQHYRALGLTAVLIEWGFATNPDDARYLLDLRSRPAIVVCAAAGIARAMELTHAPC